MNLCHTIMCPIGAGMPAADQGLAVRYYTRYIVLYPCRRSGRAVDPPGAFALCDPEPGISPSGSMSCTAAVGFTLCLSTSVDRSLLTAGTTSRIGLFAVRIPRAEYTFPQVCQMPARSDTLAPELARPLSSHTALGLPRPNVCKRLPRWLTLKPISQERQNHEVGLALLRPWLESVIASEGCAVSVAILGAKMWRCVLPFMSAASAAGVFSCGTRASQYIRTTIWIGARMWTGAAERTGVRAGSGLSGSQSWKLRGLATAYYCL